VLWNVADRDAPMAARRVPMAQFETEWNGSLTITATAQQKIVQQSANYEMVRRMKYAGRTWYTNRFGVQESKEYALSVRERMLRPDSSIVYQKSYKCPFATRTCNGKSTSCMFCRELLGMPTQGAEKKSKRKQRAQEDSD
jgi:hypothetical protein